MMAKTSAVISLEQAKNLVSHLVQGHFDLADELTAVICESNTTGLFSKVGLLTRQLHSSLEDFNFDPRIPDFALHDIPDAREHLSDIINMMDKAANREMDSLGGDLPMAEHLNDNIQMVIPNWNVSMTRDVCIGQFKIQCHQQDYFIKTSESDADELRKLLTEILMAQDFQALTDQIIRKPI
nr:protein phosphatase CheZ [Aeromonas cavernicola]